MAQQIFKRTHTNFESFFSNLKRAKEQNAPRPKPPKYLEKNGLYPLYMVLFSIKDGYLKIPVSKKGKEVFGEIKIKVPPMVSKLDVKEVSIVPILNGKWFEVLYAYKTKEKKEIKENHKKALGIDLGISNLCACVDTEGNSFIIDGKRIKSVNQWFNKESARLSSIYDKQGIKFTTKRLAVLQEKRRNQIRDYLHKTAKMVVDYCSLNNIKCIVVGNNSSIYQGTSIGRKNNQNMKFLPLGYLRDLIKHKCQKHDIEYIEVDEAYTSQASAIDKDPLPKYYDKGEYEFSGKRIKRGLYLTKSGKVINADINGSLNILRKAGFELSLTKIPVPKRVKVWGSGFKPYLVEADYGPACRNKASYDLQTSYEAPTETFIRGMT